MCSFASKSPCANGEVAKGTNRKHIYHMYAYSSYLVLHLKASCSAKCHDYRPYLWHVE